MTAKTNSTRHSHLLANTSTVRYYTPMTNEEEIKEKERVASLTPLQKDQELRALNREISKLTMLKGINTGELYTLTGKYKLLLKEYGMMLGLWYTACWMTTGVACFCAIHFGGVDAIELISYLDSYTSLDLASHVNPQLGKAGIVLVVNELLEPIRLPIVIATFRPVVDRLFPTKY